MQNLRTSANKGSNDAYDVSTSLTEDKPITAIQKACQSVSRHCLSCSIEQGNLWEKEMSINQLVFVSRETSTVLTASFLKTSKLSEWSVDRSGKPEERDSSNAQIRTLLEEQRQNDYRRVLRENWSSRTPSSSMPKKNAEFYEKNYGVSKRIFVKFINKVLSEMEEFTKIPEVLPSIRSQDESSSRTRTLLWNYQVRVQELQNEVNCMNDSDGLPGC